VVLFGPSDFGFAAYFKFDISSWRSTLSASAMQFSRTERSFALDEGQRS
jgi:hypothetical protein